MSRPVGLLRFLDEDGDPVYVEASMIVRLRALNRDDRPTSIRLRNGEEFGSTEQPEIIAARYDAIIRTALSRARGDSD